MTNFLSGGLVAFLLVAFPAAPLLGTIRMSRLLVRGRIMMEQPIQIAVIGCGWAGVRHAEAYERCGVRIGWAVDKDLRRAEALAGWRHGVHVATDYFEALNDPEVGAISICLPHDLHAQVAVDAAERGKHILCEKPLAASLEEADRMIEASERTGVCLMVAEKVRFD